MKERDGRLRMGLGCSSGNHCNHIRDVPGWLGIRGFKDSGSFFSVSKSILIILGEKGLVLRRLRESDSLASLWVVCALMVKLETLWS